MSIGLLNYNGIETSFTENNPNKTVVKLNSPILIPIFILLMHSLKGGILMPTYSKNLNASGTNCLYSIIEKQILTLHRH